MFDKTNILNESVEQNRVIDSIKKRYEVRVNYKSDDEPKGSGERIIQPVAYGLSKSGNPVIRAFQPFGDTKTKVPHWKLFRLDRFEDWKPLKNRKFSEPPLSPFKADGKFNPYGDKSMSEVYIIADFEGAKQRYEKGGLKKYNDDVRNKKIEQNPYYGLKQNIKKSVMATPEIMKRVAEWNKNKPKDMEDYLKGNNVKEMGMVQNFGDENVVQTNGPIKKSDNSIEKTETKIPQKSYDKLKSNGPISKDEIKTQQVSNFEDSNNTENLDNNNEINDINNKKEYGKQ